MRKKRTSKERKGISKILHVIKNILFYLILFIMLGSCIYLVTIKIKGKQPEIFGYKFFIVLTGSMEPDIKPGDMVIVKNTKAESIDVGDVITFTNKEGKNITTHRVTNISYGQEIEFTTKGDANNVEDENKVSESQLLGKMTRNIEGVGKIIGFIKAKAMLFIGLIIFIFFMIFLSLFIIKRIDSDLVKTKDNRIKNDSINADNN